MSDTGSPRESDFTDLDCDLTAKREVEWSNSDGLESDPELAPAGLFILLSVVMVIIYDCYYVCRK